MKVLIKSATIIDPRSPHHRKQTDVLVEGGVIQKIQKHIQEQVDEVIASVNLHVSVGWVDLGASLFDPGLEHKEDIRTGLLAAAKGGYTAVACFPNTEPFVESKSQVEYLVNKSRENIVKLLPIGAITRGLTSNEITEMYDMTASGAVAFANAYEPIKQGDTLVKALQYAKRIQKPILSFPLDKRLADGGQMHEGTVSTSLGMRGIPDMAESLMVEKEIELCQYAESSLHFSFISCANSVEAIRKAKEKGFKVTAGVSINHLLYTDQALISFDENYKVYPPYRTEKDRQALIVGVQDGTIDLISTAHLPQEEEAKKVEFEYAEPGVIGLQTAFSQLLQVKELSLEDYIEKITINPRKLLRLEPKVIEEGASAELTLFDPELTWQYTHDINASKAKNSPLLGKALTGKVIGILNQHKIYIDGK